MAGVGADLSESMAAAAVVLEPATDTPSTTSGPPFSLSSVFSSAIIQPPMEPSTGLIHEAMRKLSTLWDTQTKEIENVTEEHWRTPEFPLARLKKIMRMDEDVKMISGEVPILLSKAIEIFVTELTLRAWMQTAESKRRTVQRSDIAMAIARNDMFDFLIDIVPREEIQNKSKPSSLTNTAATRLSQADPGSSDSTSSLLQPEVLQSYLQMLYQQSEAEGGGGGGGGGDSGDSASNLMATSTLLQQQVQLLQQLIQLQQQIQRHEQEEQEQQQQHTEENDHHQQHVEDVRYSSSDMAPPNLQVPQENQVTPAPLSVGAQQLSIASTNSLLNSAHPATPQSSISSLITSSQPSFHHINPTSSSSIFSSVAGASGISLTIEDVLNQTPAELREDLTHLVQGEGSIDQSTQQLIKDVIGVHREGHQLSSTEGLDLQSLTALGLQVEQHDQQQHQD